MEAFLTDVVQSLPGVLIGYAIAALVVFGVKKGWKFHKKRQDAMWRKMVAAQQADGIHYMGRYIN